jgi:hypothetical protein
VTTRPPESNGSMKAPTLPRASASDASGMPEMVLALLDGERRTA